jgi:hypothetical protein
LSFVCAEFQNEFFDLLPARVGKILVLAANNYGRLNDSRLLARGRQLFLDGENVVADVVLERCLFRSLWCYRVGGRPRARMTTRKPEKLVDEVFTDYECCTRRCDYADKLIGISSVLGDKKAGNLGLGKFQQIGH